MKILSIVWYKVLPPEYGGQKGIAIFNKYLSKFLTLTCLCSKDNETKEVSYDVLPVLPVSKFQFLNPFAISKIVSIAKKEMPTHIILEHPYHGFAALKAAKKIGAKLIIHSHNIESERFRKMGKWWWRILRKYEKWVHRNADLSLFKTKEDLDFAIKNFRLMAEKCMVLPYGIDPERIKPGENAKEIVRKRHNISDNEKLILFSGTIDYSPNANAIENIYGKIAPLLTKNNFSFKVIITGRNKKRRFAYLKNLSHPNIIMAGEVSDIENYYEAADIFIDPVEISGGIQTKIMDSLSYDLNVICFPNALNGIDVDLCREKIFIADINNFSEKIMEALLSKNSPTQEAFINAYSFPNLAEKFVARLNSL